MSRDRLRFSLIIPAFNEEKFLPPLLDSVETARSRYSGGPAAVEVIVADNASSDGTAGLAAGRGCLVVPVEKRIIAAARNAGARQARGEILAFVDADMRIHPDTFDAIGALETWREGRKAPERIVASRIRNGKPDRTRPLCPYPQVAVYNGTGSTDEAANFTCKALR